MSNQYLDPNLKVFSLNSNRGLAEEIANVIGVELGKCTVTRFSDGEIQINIEESIRGCDVFIIQSTNTLINEHIMELLIMIDALKRASAKSICEVMPYYRYTLQDQKPRSRDPITAKLFANFLDTAVATQIITLTLHAPQIQGSLNIPITI